MNAKWLAILLLLFFSGYLAQSAQISVGGEGASVGSIQEAIDAAKEGDVIEVRSGIYKENVLVDKRLILRGGGNPVIDAGGNGTCLRLASSGIMVEGFTLINSGEYDSGIDIGGISADSNTIQDNSISHNSVGISIHSSSNNTLARNIIKNNKFSGIDLERARLSSISENIIGSNGRGICLISSNENAIRDNLIQGNREEGILLSSYLSEYGPYGFSDNNVLSGNDIRDNDYGIFLEHSENNTINGNKLINNSYGLYLEHSQNNSILGSIFINNAQNLSSDDRSREELADDASAVVGMMYGFLYILMILITFINGLILVLIGAAVGFAARIMLKDQSLSLVASSILGALGSLIGYFGYDNFISSSDGVAYLIAIVFAAVLVIAASLIARKRRGGS